MTRMWIYFASRLPIRNDADKDGQILLKEVGGKERLGTWDWVNTPEQWEANGFICWTHSWRTT